MKKKRKSVKKKVNDKKKSDSPSSKTIKGHTEKPKRTLVRKIFLFVWNTYAALAVFATIWIAVNPRVYVYPSVNLDPTNPVFTPFVVRNEGYLAIRDVKFWCSMKYLKLASGGPLIIGMGDYDNSFSDPAQVSRVIAPGEEASELLPLSNMEHNQFENADITVNLSYRPFRLWPFSLWINKEKHRFETRQGADEQWHWLPQPINK